MDTPQLIALRVLMHQKNIGAVIIPTTDPHGSEYIAPYWQVQRFITGFTGSAGTVVITGDKGGLWTDSRYFLQGEEELAGSSVVLMKDGIPSTPTIAQWLGQELQSGDVVAVDSQMFSVNSFLALKESLATYGITLNMNLEHDLIAPLWHNRPPLQAEYIWRLNNNITGQNTTTKLVRVRKAMLAGGVDALLLTALDDIAWLMNIRGNDIACNPVVISYAVIYSDKAILFMDRHKLKRSTFAPLQAHGITVADYGNIFTHLQQFDKDKKIGIDFSTANYALYQILADRACVIPVRSPVGAMKGVKNSVELAGFRKAMIKDGVALVRFFIRLEKGLKKRTVTELSASRMLLESRAEQPGFVSESFETIAAYGPHGAIVHYAPTEQSDVRLERKGLFLLDSGGHYRDGTTDITRTVALGKVFLRQRQDYTLVLKGHIALSQARFPQGTRGTQLDVLARQFLWHNALQFGHGTGHGVGHCLCVHEGLHSIRMQENPTVLQP
ncbi:MAG: aminopeptidase P family N-terminal domain-containing protein, partial [Prevotellaceae bacterium]|nr:aminopeptidase P family N-terminal domain-containing protein [Prevotellaceae bacterium]